MCGIVGIYLKNKKYNKQLGKLLTGMMNNMASRGPDSAGFAIYNKSSKFKYTVCLQDNFELKDLKKSLKNKIANANHDIQVIPGASAVTCAIAGSGLPANKFYFGGFLSTKKGARSNELEEALLREETSVFFESPHRIKSTLEILAEKSPQRQIVLAREMTKKFEEFIRGTAYEIKKIFMDRNPKGEFVLLISGVKLPKSFIFKSIE